MKYYNDNHSNKSITTKALISIKNYYNIIVDRSNLAFYDYNPNNTLPEVSTIELNDMYCFTLSAGSLLKNSVACNVYDMIVFDIDNFSDINKTYGYNVGDELLEYIEQTLHSILPTTSLFCRMHDDNYALLLENCSEIDIALLVIQLTEEINRFRTSFQVQLSFGITKVDSSENNIPSICTRAFYAKSTIKGQKNLLANFDEIVNITGLAF